MSYFLNKFDKNNVHPITIDCITSYKIYVIKYNIIPKVWFNSMYYQDFSKTSNLLSTSDT